MEKKHEENNDHNVIDKDKLPNPVSVDNDLHIKDEVFDEEELEKGKQEHGVRDDDQ